MFNLAQRLRCCKIQSGFLGLLVFNLNSFMKTLTNLRLPVASIVALLGISAGSLVAQPLYPSTVVSYTPGTTADGLGSIPDARDEQGNAIGAPQESDIDMGEVAGNSSTVNFASLGFGGEMVLGFSQPFGRGEGVDLQIFETSYNTPACASWQEFADVYISQDGCTWLQVVDNGCQNLDIELPDAMPWAMYVKIIDASPNAAFSPEADGYDVDGVKANYLSNIVPLADLNGPRFANAYSDYIVGSIKGNNNLPALNRRDPNKAVGSTTGSDVAQAPMFVSLGFDKASTAEVEGRITLEFYYTIVDRMGADLEVFETTFGDNINRTCANYPEIAEFWGSNDGVNFTLLAADPSSNEPADAYLGGPGRLCRDGKLDISGMPGGTLRFLQIVDKSIKSSNKFPGSADGYDVDGVFGYGCSSDNDGRYGLYDQNNYPDEDAGVFFMGLFPNPSNDRVNVAIETASTDENYVVRMFDITGRIVAEESINASGNSSVNVELSVAHLPAGVYTVSVDANGYKTVDRLIKN